MEKMVEAPPPWSTDGCRWCGLPKYTMTGPLGSSVVVCIHCDQECFIVPPSNCKHCVTAAYRTDTRQLD